MSGVVVLLFQAAVTVVEAPDAHGLVVAEGAIHQDTAGFGVLGPGTVAAALAVVAHGGGLSAGALVHLVAAVAHVFIGLQHVEYFPGKLAVGLADFAGFLPEAEQRQNQQWGQQQARRRKREQQMRHS
ncbi:hypothetical protein [Hymenobacter cellulosilyticus]|uniref:Uncharacterized protein n=1 Tax=Hymenobacter cellulosilyticus TaxID=2932248 RepID=A0A8T9Q5C3_9BACT|nr:hypothetical protein [Hymenobacter cellulosilyticus]UOQ72717.1 hypothetical protein MUN79_01610 [Hymenobacter cellulosilyticus]